MKQSAMLIMMTLLIVIASSFIHKNAKSSGVVDIKDVRQTHAPAPDLVNHKYHDVEVYRTQENNAESYLVYIYRIENDTIKCYGDALSMKSKPDMDKAAYKWLNDTLAAIRLYNSVSKKEVVLEVYGNGKMHGIGVKDKYAK